MPGGNYSRTVVLIQEEKNTDGNVTASETRLCQKYYDQRRAGEWFALSQADVQELDPICTSLGRKKQSQGIDWSATESIESATEGERTELQSAVERTTELGIINAGLVRIERL